MTVLKSKSNDTNIEVAPGIYQSLEDFEANMAYDEMRDNELQDQLEATLTNEDNPVY